MDFVFSTVLKVLTNNDPAMCVHNYVYTYFCVYTVYTCTYHCVYVNSELIHAYQILHLHAYCNGIPMNIFRQESMCRIKGDKP